MTRAEVDAVRPDVAAAVTYIKQARQQLASARVEGVDAESSFGLAYKPPSRRSTARCLRQAVA